MPAPNSNRSPSPLPSRPTTPHLRNSESNSAARRSFNGDTFHRPSVLANPRSFNPPPTPANSPLGFGRRLSGDGCDHEKENDQSIKPVKSRSTTIGSKNFMAPTISAAYKQSPSPRKKVLVDRNEPVRTSISLSEGKASFFSSIHSDNVSKSESFIHLKSPEAHLEQIADDSQENERPLNSKVLKKVTFADSVLDVDISTDFEVDSVVSDSDCVVTDLSAKNKSFCDSKMSPVIAPLDADPSLPPYDPKSNYLSPRPQFLHYKSKERIELLLNKEKELDYESVKLLEDNLSSFENSSDTADESQRVSEDSSTSEIESQKVSEENVHGFESLVCGGSNGLDNSENVTYVKEIDNSNAHENSEKVDNVIEIVHGYESLTHGSSNALEISEKVINSKAKEKKGLVTRLRLIFLLMVVLLVSSYSISDTYSTAIDSTILNALNYSQFHNNTPGAFIKLAKANFNGFTQSFKRFVVESMSHLSFLINNIGQGDQLSQPLQFMNLTELDNNVFVSNYPKIQQESEDSLENLESNFSEEETIDEWAEDDDDTEEDLNNEDIEQFEEVTVGDSDLALASAPIDLVSEAICENVPITPEIQEVLTESIGEKIEGNADLDSDATEKADLQIATNVITESSLEKIQGNLNLDSDSNMEETLSEDVNTKTQYDEIQNPFTELNSEINPFTMTSAFYATSVLILSVSIAFAVFNNKKRVNRKTDPNNSICKDHLPSNKKIMQQMDNAEEEEEDDDGESSSCPSEMSSFRSDQNRFRSANDEVHSEEKRLRKNSKRESFSSSDVSMNGSLSSYGSFTTYERIPIKKATGDDEVVTVTPVRRSSRIRSHVMS